MASTVAGYFLSFFCLQYSLSLSVHKTSSSILDVNGTNSTTSLSVYFLLINELFAGYCHIVLPVVDVKLVGSKEYRHLGIVQARVGETNNLSLPLWTTSSRDIS